MKISQFGFLLLLAILSFVPAAAQQPAEAAPPSDSSKEFRLSPGDNIDVKFFYHTELNDSVQVRPDGYVTLQLVGDVFVNKKSIEEVTSSLQKSYAEFLKSPFITVQVRNYAARKVYVGGEVLRPGTFNLQSDLTVLEAVMEAGGAKRTGDVNSVFLIRRDEGGGAAIRQKIALMNKKHEPTAEAMTPVRPYDVILIPETKIARADRWIDQHVRQLIPINVGGGFSYLFNTGAIR